MIYQNLHQMHFNIFTQVSWYLTPCLWTQAYNIAEDRNPTRATLRNPPQFIAFAIRCSLGTAAPHMNSTVHTPVAGAL